MHFFVSFVVMSYNFDRYLKDCVDSILQQEGQHNFEVIIVDDASTDSTKDYLNSIYDHRVRVICHSVNKGHVDTANDGFAQAKGDIIARIDGDDRYKPWFLNETLRIFQDFADVGCVYGDVASIDSNGNILEDPWSGIRSRHVHSGKDFKGDEFLALIEENFIPAATVIARRDAWKDALPIPKGFALSDWYLNLRIARMHSLYYIAKTLSEYRLHSQNLHRNFPHDYSLEKTVFSILNQIFGEEDRKAEKLYVKNRVYSLAYFNLANRYSAWNMRSDARRCYYKAFLCRPIQLANIQILKRLVLSTLRDV